MHNGFVRVDNEKMSKSFGNFFTIRDVLQRYDAETVRFFIVRTHYRSPLNYSDAHLDDARSALKRLYTALDLVAATVGHGASSAAARAWWGNFLVQKANESGVELDALAITPAQVAAVITLVDEGKLSNKLARQVVEGVLAGEGEPEQVMAGRGLALVRDDSLIQAAVDEALAFDLINKQSRCCASLTVSVGGAARLNPLATASVLEPLLNLPSVTKACQLLNQQLGISARSLTISTVGGARGGGPGAVEWQGGRGFVGPPGARSLRLQNARASSPPSPPRDSRRTTREPGTTFGCVWASTHQPRSLVVEAVAVIKAKTIDQFNNEYMLYLLMAQRPPHHVVQVMK
jgi:hypothetical protein